MRHAGRARKNRAKWTLHNADLSFRNIGMFKFEEEIVAIEELKQCR
jgi:hypothetical protein